MYHYVEDKEFLKRMRSRCSDMVNQVVQLINKEKKYSVKMELVGSGANNLVTQNDQSAVDLDYNLIILKTDEDINDGKIIKEYVRKVFNVILNKNNLKDCNDSTSCLTTKEICFKGETNYFSIDLAIIRKSSKGNWLKLKHKKTGKVATDEWYWNEIPESKEVNIRSEWLKKNGKWNDVRNAYLDKKNMYLKNKDDDHPSFICYIETINELYFTNIKQKPQH